MTNFDVSKLKFDSNGLIPCIVQEHDTAKVLMFAYMNKESIEQTINTGKGVFFSRSRNELWEKGATSGNTQEVMSLCYDCDADCLLMRVRQTGVACHTGEYSCFYNEIYSKNAIGRADIVSKLFAKIADRRENPVEGSYTNYLFEKGIDKILKKVGEESAEVIIAAKNPNKSELIYESCDLVYHMLVLLIERGVSLEELADELIRRAD